MRRKFNENVCADIFDGQLFQDIYGWIGCGDQGQNLAFGLTCGIFIRRLALTMKQMVLLFVAKKRIAVCGP